MYEIGLVYTQTEIEILKNNNKLVNKVHEELRAHCVVGTTTRQLDKLAAEIILDNEAVPAFKGYRGYPFSICTSINDTIVHGFPSDTELKDGDIISLDVGVKKDGMYGDACIMLGVGDVSLKAQKLIEVTNDALNKATSIIKDGVPLGTVGNVIETVGKKNGYGVVSQYIGHGIGYLLHDFPRVQNIGKIGKGFILKEGMVICIEPMFTEHKADSFTVPGKWDVKTKDGGLATHVEHCVLVLKEGCEILNM